MRLLEGKLVTVDFSPVNCSALRLLSTPLNVKGLSSYLPTLLPSKKDPSPKSKISTLPQGEGKRVAFTLAEVLITLGIIGIVAAITMPALITKYQEQAMVTRLKKFYSTFSQAYAMAVLENGTIDNWGLINSTYTTDDEGDSVYSPETVESIDKFWAIMDKYLKKAGSTQFNSAKYREYIASNGYGHTLADGTQIVGTWILPSVCGSGNENEVCGDFYVKVSNKKYSKGVSWNSMKDVFVFYINPNKITPGGLGGAFHSPEDCLNGTNYLYCSGWVLTHGNMDYLHCDDLDFNTKTKCK